MRYLNTKHLMTIFVLFLSFHAISAEKERIFMRIFKADKVLQIWKYKKGGYKLFKSYPICYFSGKLGPKTKQGDLQAPEGIYSLTKSSLNPNSRFYLSMNIGYPNFYDRQKKRTGNYIMIHGDCVSLGCFAMTNRYIKSIYAIVKNAFKNQKRIPLHIFPFGLTNKNMKKYKNHEWYGFWQELKPIYQYFQKHKKVPRVVVKNRTYLIRD